MRVPRKALAVVLFPWTLVFLALAALFSQGCSETHLGSFCPAECPDWPEDEAMKYEGLCNPGRPICDADFNILSCAGRVLPAPDRTCDGFDNDCDGMVDEHWLDKMAWRVPADENPCESTMGRCANARVVCDDGEVVCSYPPSVETNPDGTLVDDEKRCDDVDGDCDGYVDERIYGEYCYSGPEGTQYNLPCDAGYEMCIDGAFACVAEVVPSEELACTRVDEDCNGLIDDVEPEEDPGPVDVVFGVDPSGSMGAASDPNSTLAKVAEGLHDQLETFRGRPEVRFALVNICTNYNTMKLVQDFTDIDTMHTALAAITAGGAHEHSLDYLHGVCTDDLVEITNGDGDTLSWRDGALRISLLFTDEDLQSYTSPRITVSDVVDDCVGRVAHYIWSSTMADFRDITTATDGEWTRMMAGRDVEIDLGIALDNLCPAR